MASIPRPMIGVAAIIKKEGKVLIGKRKSKHACGFWGFPGGHLEYGETFEQTAIRETLEETGLNISNPAFWWLENVVFPEEKKHYLTIFMVSDWKKGKPKVIEPTKCVEWIWAPWDELPQPIMPGIAMLIAEGLDPFCSTRTHEL